VKVSDLRQMPTEDLQHKRDQLVQEYFGLRIKHSLGQLEDPLVLRRIRRDIARAKTLLTQRGVQEVVRRRRHTTAGSRPAATDKQALKPRPAEAKPAKPAKPEKRQKPEKPKKPQKPEKAAKREKRAAAKAAAKEAKVAKAAKASTSKSRPAKKQGKAGKSSSSKRGKG
jgi:large subunit ribosomal protein L29